MRESAQVLLGGEWMSTAELGLVFDPYFVYCVDGDHVVTLLESGGADRVAEFSLAELERVLAER